MSEVANAYWWKNTFIGKTWDEERNMSTNARCSCKVCASQRELGGPLSPPALTEDKKGHHIP